MNKKVTIGSKPTAKDQAANVDDWVEHRNTESTETKRLTIDIPASLHSRIKVDCARRGVKMAEEIRQLLDRHFAE
jgi:macrodomain Ter protein organizer (MatP/YcbG family)